jgi:hypothetical protein
MPAIPKAAAAAAAALLLAAAVPAAAQAPGGADRLRAAVERAIERQHRINSGELRLVWKGRVEVEPRGDAFLVRMPHLTVSGSVYLVDVGRLAATARQSGDGFVLREAVPAAAVAYGADLRPMAEIRIGGGASEVEIDADGLVLDADVRATDVVAEAAAGEPFHLTLGALAFVQTVSAAADAGRLDAEYAYRLERLAARERAGGPALVEAAEIAVTGRAGGLSREALLRFADGVLPRLLAASEAADPSAPDVLAAALDLLDALDGMATGISGGVSATGIGIALPGEPPVAIGRISYQASADGLDGDRGAAAFSAAVEGVRADAGAAVPREAVPERIALGLSATGLPHREAIGLLREALRAEAAGDATAGDAMGERLFAALLQAGSEFRLDELDLSAPAFGASAEGAGKLDPAAAFRAAGRIRISLRGLEEALEIAERFMGPPQPDIGVAVAVLSAMGRQETDDRGRPVRRYDVEVGADGRALLNGADLAPIVRSIAGGR